MILNVAAPSAAVSVPANTISVTWPTVVAGDFAVIFLGLGGLSAITTPTGFTAGDTLDESTTLRAAAFTRICDGTETGSLSVAWGGTAQNAAMILAVYRGADATTPVNIHTVNGAVSTATSRAANAIGTQSLTLLEVVAFLDVQTTAATSWTPPASFTERADVSATATPFVSAEVSDLMVLPPFGGGGLASRTGTSAQSGTAFVAFHIGLAQLVSSLTDVTMDLTTWGQGGAGAITVPTITFSSPQTATSFRIPVTTGQLWPRGTK